MDCLPIELLRHIIDSLVDFDIRTTTNQTTLATLAQVNKTLNAIVIPRLYLHPVLTTNERAQSWATFYSSKASLCGHNQDWQAVREVVIPLSLTFSPLCGLTRSPLPAPNQYESSIADILFPPNSSISSSFFFRNLTSFTVYPEHLVDINFTAALFGPTSYNRDTIVDLSIRSVGNQWHLILFLLDAHQHFPSSELSDEESGDDTRDGEENGRERTLTSGSSFREEDNSRMSSSFAEDSNHGICYVFNRHSLLEDETRDFLPYVLNSRSIPVTPFANLINLSLSLSSNAELCLIFLTPLFPVLRTLKLDGQIWTTDHIEDDVAMFRYSITKRTGQIYPPMVDEEVREEFGGLFDVATWIALSEIEMERYPWNPYDGPNLDVLDLTECEVQWSDEP